MDHARFCRGGVVCRGVPGMNTVTIGAVPLLYKNAPSCIGSPAHAHPLSPSRQVPASMAFVTDSNRPQPLGQSSNRLPDRLWGHL